MRVLTNWRVKPPIFGRCLEILIPEVSNRLLNHDSIVRFIVRSQWHLPMGTVIPQDKCNTFNSLFSLLVSLLYSFYRRQNQKHFIISRLKFMFGIFYFRDMSVTIKRCRLCYRVGRYNGLGSNILHWSVRNTNRCNWLFNVHPAMHSVNTFTFRIRFQHICWLQLPNRQDYISMLPYMPDIRFYLRIMNHYP